MAKKQKKEWAPEEVVPWPLWKKALLTAILAFIPFFFGVILPMVTINHIVTKMKLAEEILLGKPDPIHMVYTAEPPPSMLLRMGVLQARVPRGWMPVQVGRSHVLLRQSPRRVARSIFLQAWPETPPVDLSSVWLFGLFIPDEPVQYFDTILWSTWHPVRLMCKANFLVSQGIAARFFEALMDDKHRAFVFPTPGNTGYTGRSFQTKHHMSGECSYFDEVHAVTLRDWVNLAMGLKFLPPVGSTGNKADTVKTPLEELLRRSAANGSPWEIVEESLNGYFATGSSSWMLPLTRVMAQQDYIPEAISFIRRYSPDARGTDLAPQWNELLNTIVSGLIKVDLEPHLQLNKFVCHIENTSRLPLRNLRLQFSLTLRIIDGEHFRTFTRTFFHEGQLRPGLTESIEVTPPHGIFIHGAKNLAYQIEYVEVDE